MRVTSHSALRDAPASVLDLLHTTGLYSSPAWLGYCEQAAAGRMRYVTVEEDGICVGVLGARLVTEPGGLPLYDLSSFLDGSMDGYTAQAIFPNTVAAVSGASCLFEVVRDEPEASARRRRALIGGLVDAATREGCRTVGLLYLTDPDAVADAVAAFSSGAAISFLASAGMELAGGWPDFEGYLATLPSSRRNKIRRERKRFTDAGLTARVATGTSALGVATARLQLALRERHGVGGTLEAIQRDYEALAAHVEDRVRVVLVERDDDLVGMSLGLLDGTHLHVRLAGFDYEAIGEDFVYFNAVYYEPIQWGIEAGITSYSFGTGTYRAKRARGCVPVLSFGVVEFPEDVASLAHAALAEHESRLRSALGLPEGATPCRTSPEPDGGRP